MWWGSGECGGGVVSVVGERRGWWGSRECGGGGVDSVVACRGVESVLAEYGV